MSESAPLLVVIVDERWLDTESAEAIIFPARRLRYDRAVFILTPRSKEASPHDLAGFLTYPLTGLTQQDVAETAGRWILRKRWPFRSGSPGERASLAKTSRRVRPRLT